METITTVDGLDIYKVRKEMINFIYEKKGDEITYEKFLKGRCNIDPTGNNHLKKILFGYLTTICEFEHSRDRSLLSIVVVARDSMIPGQGFFKVMADLKGKGKDKNDIRSDLTSYVKEKKRCLKYWRKDKNYRRFLNEDVQLKEFIEKKKRESN